MTVFTPDGAPVDVAVGVVELDVGALGWLGPEQAESATSASTADATPVSTTVLRLRVDMRDDLSLRRSAAGGHLGSKTYRVGA